MSDTLPAGAEDTLAEMRSGVDMIRWAASTMNRAEVFFGHGYDNAIDEAVRLVLHCLDLPVGTPDSLLQARLGASEREAIAAMLRRRVIERVPLAYLTGQTSFAGLEFLVTPDVLIPRSPLAEFIENSFSPWIGDENVHSILEIGTGSGCLAITCAHQFPAARIIATDISSAALNVACANVTHYGLQEQLELRISDVWSQVDETFDVIISNPPYVTRADLEGAPAEFAHEPRLGLAAGEDGLDIVREILAGAPKHLNRDGILVVEVGVTQPYVEDQFPDLPFTWLEFERGGQGVFVLERDALCA